MARIVVDKTLEFVTHPFVKGLATINGVVYSQVFNAGTANTAVPTNAGAFNVIDHAYPGGRGAIKELEVGLTASYQANATTLCNTRWEGRNLDPLAAAWVVVTPDENHNMTTAWTDKTFSGYLLPQAGFNSIPFEIRMSYRTNHADVGLGRMKNSSYVRCLYQIN